MAKLIKNPASKTLYRLRHTGTVRRLEWEAGPAVELPEVELIEIDPSISEIESYDGVARVEGEKGAFYLVLEEFLYDREAPGSMATVLVREFVGMDAGDNVQRRRVAPQSRQGIAARMLGAGHIRAVAGDPVFAVKPKK